ncbi:phosphate acetyltransferase [Kitasatospora sp. NPDC093102]|uniref:phosphate acetyltransferase n=1 Tax=Kitasatospora sp. NPDC093102 TaxID=3155069 RepID=UPI003427DCFE
MTRSVYITGLGRGDGREVVDLGMMELLTRHVARVGVYRPLTREGPDHLFDLLRSRYRLSQDPATAHGMSHPAGASLQAERGTDELVSRLVDRFHAVAREHEVVLVLGSDYHDTRLPTELALNARLANEFGACVLTVVGGRHQSADSVVDEVHNAHRALTAQDCDVVAVIANRIAPDRAAQVAEHLKGRLPVPVYVLPEDASLAAPTVAQVVQALDGEVLLGDDAGLARSVLDYVFGGATLPTLLPALTPGCLMITPGDRCDLVVGALAAHSAGAPAIAGVLLTLGQRPGPDIMTLADRLAPGTPVISVAGRSFPTATALSTLEGELTTATPHTAEVALGLFETHVDTRELTRRLSMTRGIRVTPMMFEHQLTERARADRRHIVLPEGTEERILRAAGVLLRRNVCDLTLLGEESAVRRRAAGLGIHLGPEAGDHEERAICRIVDPHDSPLRETFAQTYAELRAHKGITLEMAHDLIVEGSYFGTLMVHQGLADGMVSGAVHSTAATIRPAFEVIRTATGVSSISSVFFMCLPDQVLVYGDCAINPDPDAEQLADIAIQSARTATQFHVEPRVAMLSYSTGTSGAGADVDKVRDATAIVRERCPQLPVEGPIQYDAAVDPGVAATKLPGSKVAGHATVLVFPDLDTGNNTYKAVQRSANAIAIGPVLQGLRKPVNDLSRGALVQDIVNTVAITAIQAQGETRSPGH